MPKPGWLNDNLNRAFPFLKGSVHRWNASTATIEGLDNEAVVDAGFIVGLNAGFVDGVHSIFLDAVRRVGDTIYFDFASDAPGLADRIISFARSATTWASHQTEHVEVEDTEISLASAGMPHQTCIQMGTSGTLVAPSTGTLRLYFNDNFWGDNSGYFIVNMEGQKYTVPATAVDGVDGPHVEEGHSYDYTASGQITWKLSRPSNSNPDGTYDNPHFVADRSFICPGLQAWSLVAKIKLDPIRVGSSNCGGDPLFSGYLVTGKLTQLLTVLPGDGTITRSGDGGIVEPALIQNLALSYASTVNISNADRTRVTAPPGCPDIVWPFEPGTIFINARCLTGHIRFKPGYNAIVQQQTTANQIVIGAGVNAGEGQPCDEVSLYAGEQPPEGSQLLEGGPTCNEVVRSINGVGGLFGALLSGPGVTITQVPAQNKLIVDVNMNQLAVCYTETPFSDVSQSL